MNKHIKYFLKGLIIALILEVFLFNIKCFTSFFYPEKATYTDFKDSVEIKSKDDYERDIYYKRITIPNIDKKVKNIYFDIDYDSVITVGIKISDEGNEELYDLGDNYYLKSIKPSKYITINPYGKVKNMHITLMAYEENIDVNNITINRRVAFAFNILRVLLITLGILIYKELKDGILDFNFADSKSIYYLIIIGAILSFLFMAFEYQSNYGLVKTDGITNHDQYNLLADAFIHGRTTIDLPVTDKLKELDNPYDTEHRDNLLKVNEDYYLDYAYYNGKYYSYFGVVPCLLFYVPCNLLGVKPHNGIVLVLGSLFFMIGVFYLVYQVALRFHPKLTFKWYLFLSLLEIFSGVFLVFHKGYFYGIPIIFGSGFTTLAIGFYLKATSDDKISVKYTLLGSIFMALVAGCRPQILLTGILVIPLYWPYLKHKNIKFKELLSFILPYLIVGISLMVYNYIRFGSIIDFGANYNLTSNDMTRRGFSIQRIIIGLYSFLLEVPHMKIAFPFIDVHKIVAPYNGITIYELMPGGFLAINAVCILGILIFLFKDKIKNKVEYKIGLIANIAAITIAAFDANIAGILPRYMLDFGPLICLSTTIVVFSILDNKTNKQLLKVLTIAICISLFLNIMVYFGDGFLNGYYKNFYLYMYYTFMFWI